MMRALPSLGLVALLLPGCGGSGGGGSDADAVVETVFVHVATIDTVEGPFTRVGHPLLDGNASARIVVTPILDPEGFPTPRNPHPIGVMYGAPTGSWLIVNEDEAAMPVDAAFVVRIVQDEPSLVQTANGRTANYTIITDPAAGDADATLIVTQHLNASGDVVPNASEIGVWHTGDSWTVFNQNRAHVMPVGASFVVVRPRLDAFVHHATLDNTVLDFTYVSHPSIDDRPGALLEVTQNWNPDDDGVYNEHPIAVHYREAEGLWTIVDQDGAAIPVGASFNVWVR